MASIFAVFFLLCISLVCGGAHAQAQEKQNCNHINLGYSLHLTIAPTIAPKSWPSLSGKFAFGFYPEGNGTFMVGIWLVGIDNITVVWTASRDDPPLTSNATLELTKGGKLVLRTDDEQGGREKLISATLDGINASFACMLDSGNFVLYQKNGSIIWESFRYPTDTILGGQILSSGGQLFSSLSVTNHSTGRYRLKMQYDGNLVLYPVNTVDVSSEAYWSSETDGFQYHLYLNYTGLLQIFNSTNDRVWNLYSDASNNTNTIYRATLDVDGFFRLYSHAFDESGKLSSSVVEFSRPSGNDLCEVKGFCGFNSFCTRNDGKPYCVCLPGTDFVDVNDQSLGCERNFSQVGCGGGKDEVACYNINTTDNMIWDDIPYADVPMTTKEECNNSCFEDCNCEAALFNDSRCKKQKLPLRYVRRDTSEDTIAFFKVGIRSIKRWNEISTPVVHVFASKKVMVQILVLILAFTAFSCLALGISGL
jgi:hypothetical protein